MAHFIIQMGDISDIETILTLRKIGFIYDAKHRPPESYSNRFLKRVLDSRRSMEERILSGCCIFKELKDKLKETGMYSAFEQVFEFNKDTFMNQDIEESGPYILQGILTLEDAIQSTFKE